MDDRTGTRIIEGPDGRELVLPQLVLEVVDGPDKGKSVRVDRLSLRVGSEADNDLVLTDDAVSSHHFELQTQEGGIRLRDLGSTNGTRIHGVRVEQAWLETNLEVVAGTTRLMLTPSQAEQTKLRLSRRTNFGGLLGHSPAMRAAFAVLEHAAKTDATVLVLGESGTGKELAARGLHDRGSRADGPYVVFDCGAASATLVESQLFGHDKGAFTGATEARAGVFEAADGGTLVLDEIGELPLELQPKFLRVLESRTVCRLGENQDRAVDVRVIACTHRNLQELSETGAFRQDLYFRLSVIVARLPPLRDRREEIPRLARHFLSQLSEDSKTIDNKLLQVLEQHDWPGNVRELRNFIERLIALPGLDPTDLLTEDPSSNETPRVGLGEPFHDAKRRFTEQFERAYLEALLAAHGENISEAARVSGLSRQTCYRLMRKYGLDPD